MPTSTTCNKLLRASKIILLFRSQQYKFTEDMNTLFNTLGGVMCGYATCTPAVVYLLMKLPPLEAREDFLISRLYPSTPWIN